MEWWKVLLVGYGVVTYALGVFICLSYLIAYDLAKSTSRIRVDGNINKNYWPAALLYVLLSPIIVPWWLITFIRANKGGV